MFCQNGTIRSRPKCEIVLGPLLSGVFEINLDWDVSQPAETTDNLLRAAEAQLGLKLERKKVQMEVVVVDHAEKIPTAN